VLGAGMGKEGRGHGHKESQRSGGAIELMIYL
jgi:hypothetical protein